MRDLTFHKALEVADHLKAVGWTDIWLHKDEPRPWEFVTDVEAGGSYRLSGPASAKCVAKHPSGLTFNWFVDFEERDANGGGIHLFARDRLRDVMRKLPPAARASFAALLRNEVMPAVRKYADEIRNALNKQEDSLDLVRGLIAFADDPTVAA